MYTLNFNHDPIKLGNLLKNTHKHNLHVDEYKINS